MKATGIVRRIEEYGIIGQKLKNRVNTMGFADFCPTQFAQNPVKIGFSIKKARCSIHIRSFKFTNNGNIEILCDDIEMKKIDEDEMALRCLREDKGLPRKIQKTT